MTAVQFQIAIHWLFFFYHNLIKNARCSLSTGTAYAMVNMYKHLENEKPLPKRGVKRGSAVKPIPQQALLLQTKYNRKQNYMAK